MSARATVTIGTRGSDLALWQARWVEKELRAIAPDIELRTLIIKTTGDKILDSPLSRIGDKGLFTKEIEKALLDRAIDLAVHSLKDVPTEITPGLMIGAISEREDVRDVFICHPERSHRSLRDVPDGGTIATGSLRRKCQLLNLRPDLRIVDLRGNLKTRREKLAQSSWDGMLLAKAGVTRLGWSDMITEIIAPTTILPAVGQGALAIEIRNDDIDLRTLVAPINHVATMRTTLAERSLLRQLEGGCQVPIGTYGRIERETLLLDAVVGSLDGKSVVRGSINGDPEGAEALGSALAHELLELGADRILEVIRRHTG